ncbi:MAG: lysophospholipid acyltransferase family protein [Alphaproteobacteria bacterium]
MNTWNAEHPPELPPPTPGGRIAGILRMAAFLSLTAVALAVFITGHYLRVWFGRWVTYHFLAARLWSRAGLWLTGLTLVVRGTLVESGALVSNHSSWADILTLRSAKLMYFVAKAEVRNWPGVGFITAITGTIFIERKRSQAKQQELALRERIAARQLLVFFPEGTSTDGLRVLPFKSSLFSAFFYDHHGADLWIQPVTVRYTPAPNSGLPPNFYGWWGDMELGSHIWAVMSRSFGGRAEVIFHQPVKPQAFRDRKALAEYCGNVVARGLTETG